MQLRGDHQYHAILIKPLDGFSLAFNTALTMLSSAVMRTFVRPSVRYLSHSCMVCGVKTAKHATINFSPLWSCYSTGGPERSKPQHTHNFNNLFSQLFFHRHWGTLRSSCIIRWSLKIPPHPKMCRYTTCSNATRQKRPQRKVNVPVSCSAVTKSRDVDSQVSGTPQAPSRVKWLLIKLLHCSHTALLCP